MEKETKELAVTREVLPSPSAPPTFMELIAQNSKDPNFDANKLRVLQEMFYHDQDRERERLYNEAMLALRSELPKIKKNGEIDYGKGKNPIKYARLDDIEKEIEPIYRKHGFFVEYDKDDTGRWLGICKHKAGHKEVKRYDAEKDDSGGKNKIQAQGSAFSYAQRALLKMIFNLIFEGEDDDGMGGAITTEQSAEIDLRINELGMDKAKFMEKYKITDIRELRSKHYMEALNSIDAYDLRKQKKEGQKNAKVS